MKNVLIGLFLLAAGIGLAWWGKGMLNEARASKNWPSVEGTVTESTLVRYKSSSGSGSEKQRKTLYKPQITYQYTVDGRVLTGDKVSTGDYGSASTSHAKKVMRKYPVGAHVTVYYDPEVPEDAVLEPGATLISYVPLGMGLLSALLGALTFLDGIFKVMKKIFSLGTS